MQCFVSRLLHTSQTCELLLGVRAVLERVQSATPHDLAAGLQELTVRLVAAADAEEPGECDLLYGRAGLLYALLYVRHHLGPAVVPEATLRHLAQHIVAAGA